MHTINGISAFIRRCCRFVDSLENERSVKCEGESNTLPTDKDPSIIQTAMDQARMLQNEKMAPTHLPCMWGRVKNSRFPTPRCYSLLILTIHSSGNSILPHTAFGEIMLYPHLNPYLRWFNPNLWCLNLHFLLKKFKPFSLVKYVLTNHNTSLTRPIPISL